jgi:phosphoglucomutase
VLLTASHNPGGETEDFGIKFNTKNGGPALEALTDKIFENTLSITHYKSIELATDIDISTVGVHKLGGVEGFDHEVTVEVIDSCEMYIGMMQSLFDFDALKALVARPDFNLLFDGMHGAAGPYAKRILGDILGVKESSLLRCNVLPDFGKGHPDPNLTYAHDLVELMGVFHHRADAPDFGAACDGDADRNMILGKNFFVTPSDSIAIITANYKSIPFLKAGIHGAARSMPTSGALDRVLEKLGLPFFEVPTGWKFFGNLLDASKISLCGEESFGTGSFHIREKDGLWAVLCWLSILADKNKGSEKLISIEDIVKAHWAEYGRNYYQRYDYENLDTPDADKVFKQLDAEMEVFKAEAEGNTAVNFTYTDPVDGSVSKNQGYIFKWADGSRFVFRLSGTGSSGATIRIYLEKYSKESDMQVEEALKAISERALNGSKIHELTGRTKPTVIT